MYVIYYDNNEQVGHAKKQTTVRQYWSIDSYPYWSTTLTAAKVFKTCDEAADVLAGDEFTNRSFVDGMSYPPRMLHSALGLSKTKIAGTVEIHIGELRIHHIIRNTFQDCIRDETDTVRKAALAKLTKAEKTALGL